MRALVLALVLAGCASRTPPEQVYISPEFTTDERVVILDALDAWCEATDWCPEETDEPLLFGSIVLTEAMPDADAQPGYEVSGNNLNNGTVRILRSSFTRGDMSQFWTTVSHEIGHFCADHTGHGLMAAQHSPGDALDVDNEAVEAWKDGCQ